VLFAGAATVAALLLFSTVRPGATDTVVASGSAIAGAGGFPTDDGFVNDNGQTSGDIFQQNLTSGTGLKFAIPREGGSIWTDNMVIPKGAVNKFTAELMMNFVYDPKIAAQIENYVYYVSPVNGAKAELEALNKSAPLDQYHLDLLFPPDAVVAKQKNFQFLSPDLETMMDQLFLDLSGS